MKKLFDAVIIGAGVSGCSAARFLSMYNCSVCVVEKEEDVCCGTSKANSAIVHAGYDAKTGSLMAKLNVEGSKMMEQLSKDLDIPYERCGSLVVRTKSDSHEALEALLERGKANGVEKLEIVSGERLKELEPNLSDDSVEALWAPTAAIICPFELTIALGENAVENGAEFKFNTRVTGVKPCGDHWIVETDNGTIETKTVINAAGVYADEIHNFVSTDKMHIVPRRGDYYLLDRTAGPVVHHTIFQLPDEKGKGILVSPTAHGNTIVGPTAIDTDDKDDVSTTAEGFAQINEKAFKCVKNIPLNQTITNFAGLRAHEEKGDFIIGEVEGSDGFFDCAAIASPGLSAAPAIGKMLAELVAGKLGLSKKDDFKATRKGIIDPKKLSIEERNELIKNNPSYGRIICRCESVTEGEIVEALRRPLPAKSLDGVKRRTRAGMGRCQAGFCGPKTMELIARELGISMADVTKAGGSSKMITGTIKSGLADSEAANDK